MAALSVEWRPSRLFGGGDPWQSPQAGGHHVLNMTHLSGLVPTLLSRSLLILAPLEVASLPHLTYEEVPKGGQIICPRS